MTTPTQLPPETVKRNRGMLILLFVIFFGSMAVAGLLRFSGWRPAGVETQGHLLSPALDAREHAPVALDGRKYAWNPVDRRWRLLVIAPDTVCDEACEQTASDIDKIWQMLNKNSERVDIFWVGATSKNTHLHANDNVYGLSSQASIRSVLPAENNVATAKGLPIFIVDPNGFVMMEYKPGADIGGVRKDLAKVLKLR